jgi:hypothetical protein
MTLRFVILHHTGVREPHYDLMIESAPGGALQTWRSERNPLDSYLAAAHRIDDHRRDYLDFEGEVSGGRGRVTRVASGTCTFVQEQPGAWVFQHDAPAAKYRSYYLVQTDRPPLWIIEGKNGTEVGQTA